MEYLMTLLGLAVACMGAYTLARLNQLSWRLDRHKEQIEFLTQQLAEQRQGSNSRHGANQLMR